jgi:hypothetical protein
MQGRVQDCGCIALPEDLQQMTGLNPGATFELKLAPDGSALLLIPVETKSRSTLYPGVQCGPSS